MREDPNPLELPFLQHTQELDLDVRCQIARFHRGRWHRPPGSLEAALPRCHGTGEGPFSWPKSSLSISVGRQRRAIDPHEGPRVPPAALSAAPARSNSFATAGRSTEQNVRVGRRDLLQPGQRGLKTVRSADDLVEIVTVPDRSVADARCRPPVSLSSNSLQRRWPQGGLVARTPRSQFGSASRTTFLNASGPTNRWGTIAIAANEDYSPWEGGEHQYDLCVSPIA